MTREEALAMYHPIRASVRRILGSAISLCNQSDLMRAAKQLGLWADGKIVLPEGDEAAEMLSDIALFEPNQRGRRVRCLSCPQGASTRGCRFRTGPTNGRRALFLVSIQHAPRGGRCLA